MILSPLLCLGSSRAIEQHAVPAIHYVKMNIKLIDHAHRDVIDHVVEVLWVVVERGYGRKYHDAHARQLQHVFEMYLVEWRLAHNQHELASLFQDHVGGAMDQIIAETVSDGGEGAHAAWRDHHTE